MYGSGNKANTVYEWILRHIKARMLAFLLLVILLNWPLVQLVLMSSDFNEINKLLTSSTVQAQSSLSLFNISIRKKSYNYLKFVEVRVRCPVEAISFVNWLKRYHTIEYEQI